MVIKDWVSDEKCDKNELSLNMHIPILHGNINFSLRDTQIKEYISSLLHLRVAMQLTSTYWDLREFSIRNHFCLSSITPWNGCVKQVLADNPIQCYQELLILFWTNLSSSPLIQDLGRTLTSTLPLEEEAHLHGETCGWLLLFIPALSQWGGALSPRTCGWNSEFHPSPVVVRGCFSFSLTMLRGRWRRVLSPE